MSSVKVWAEQQAARAREQHLGTHRVTVSIGAAAYQKLGRVATAVGRSRSSCAEELLERAIEEAWEVVGEEGLDIENPPVTRQPSSVTERRGSPPPGEREGHGAEPLPTHGADYGLDRLEHLGKSVLGAKPYRLSFPDGTQAWVPEWKDLDREIVRWLGERHSLPVPFRISPGGRRYFLNTVPRHEDGEEMEPRGQVHEVEVGGQRLHLYTKIAADIHVQCVCALIRNVGANLSEFRLSLRVKPSSGGLS
jgi:hypothetical protein